VPSTTPSARLVPYGSQDRGRSNPRPTGHQARTRNNDRPTPDVSHSHLCRSGDHCNNGGLSTKQVPVIRGFAENCRWQDRCNCAEVCPNSQRTTKTVRQRLARTTLAIPKGSTLGRGRGQAGDVQPSPGLSRPCDGGVGLGGPAPPSVSHAEAAARAFTRPEP